MSNLIQKLQSILSEKLNKILPQNIRAGNTIFGVTGIAPLTFATIEEMNEHLNYPEDTYAIVHGVNYIGTYRMDSGKWTEVGDKSEGQQIFDQLNLISNTNDQYEGAGGTDKEIISKLYEIKPTYGTVILRLYTEEYNSVSRDIIESSIITITDLAGNIVNFEIIEDWEIYIQFTALAGLCSIQINYKNSEIYNETINIEENNTIYKSLQIYPVPKPDYEHLFNAKLGSQTSNAIKFTTTINPEEIVNGKVSMSSNDYAITSNKFDFTNLTEFTLSMIVHFTGFSTHGYVFAIGGFRSGFGMHYDGGDKLQMYNYGIHVGDISNDAQSAINDNTKAALLNIILKNSILYYYINGVLQGTSNLTNTYSDTGLPVNNLAINYEPGYGIAGCGIDVYGFALDATKGMSQNELLEYYNSLDLSIGGDT